MSNFLDQDFGDSDSEDDFNPGQEVASDDEGQEVRDGSGSEGEQKPRVKQQNVSRDSDEPSRRPVTVEDDDDDEHDEGRHNHRRSSNSEHGHGDEGAAHRESSVGRQDRTREEEDEENEDLGDEDEEDEEDEEEDDDEEEISVRLVSADSFGRAS